MTRLNPIALAALAGVIALVAVLGARSQPQPARGPQRIWEMTTKLADLARAEPGGPSRSSGKPRP